MKVICKNVFGNPVDEGLREQSVLFYLYIDAIYYNIGNVYRAGLFDVGTIFGVKIKKQNSIFIDISIFSGLWYMLRFCGVFLVHILKI